MRWNRALVAGAIMMAFVLTLVACGGKGYGELDGDELKYVADVTGINARASGLLASLEALEGRGGFDDEEGAKEISEQLRGIADEASALEPSDRFEGTQRTLVEGTEVLVRVADLNLEAIEGDRDALEESRELREEALRLIQKATRDALDAVEDAAARAPARPTTVL